MRAVTGVLVALHIVASVVGFGAACATGVLALAAARDPASPAACRYFEPGPNWASYLVLLVPAFGAGLEASSGWADLHRAWPWIALGIWAVAVAAGALHWPAERRLQRLLAGVWVAPARPEDTSATQNPPRDPSAGGAGANWVGPAHRGRTKPTRTPRRDPGPGRPAGARGDLRAACRRTAWTSAVMTVCFLAALAVMVVQP